MARKEQSRLALIYTISVCLVCLGAVLALFLSLKQYCPNLASAIPLTVRIALIAIMAILGIILVGWWVLFKTSQITARYREEQQNFISAVSHELRSPLAVIRTGASAIRIDPSQLSKILPDIEGECERLGTLVDNMTTLINSEKCQLFKREVSLDTILIDLESHFYELAKSHNFLCALIYRTQ